MSRRVPTVVRERASARAVRRASTSALVVALGLGLMGCASGPEARAECPAAAPIPLAIEASARLNPDPLGRALPTELRLYQLRDAAPLDAASFEDLWMRASESLGSALIAEESVTVYPEQRLDRALVLDPATRALAAVLIVREPTGRTWRAVVPMTPSGDAEACPSHGPTRLLLRLDDYRIEAITPRTTTETPG